MAAPASASATQSPAGPGVADLEDSNVSSPLSEVDDGDTNDDDIERMQLDPRGDDGDNFSASGDERPDAHHDGSDSDSALSDAASTSTPMPTTPRRRQKDYMTHPKTRDRGTSSSINSTTARCSSTRLASSAGPPAPPATTQTTSLSRATTLRSSLATLQVTSRLRNQLRQMTRASTRTSSTTPRSASASAPLSPINPSRTSRLGSALAPSQRPMQMPTRICP